MVKMQGLVLTLLMLSQSCGANNLAKIDDPLTLNDSNVSAYIYYLRQLMLIILIQ